MAEQTQWRHGDLTENPAPDSMASTAPLIRVFQYEKRRQSRHIAALCNGDKHPVEPFEY